MAPPAEKAIVLVPNRTSSALLNTWKSNDTVSSPVSTSGIVLLMLRVTLAVAERPTAALAVAVEPFEPVKVAVSERLPLPTTPAVA